MESIDFNIEHPTAEQATILVNSMLFPQAVVGDRVKQYEFWFVLSEDGWIIDPQ